ncbi:MAG: inositol monophosphatase family protein [Planctomycetota bacterium]
MNLTALLEAAQSAVDAGAALALRSFRKRLQVRLKADSSPVTEVDVAVEEAIRSRLARQFADIAFFGEESGESGDEDALARWILDPIDGTENFIAGIPVFATLLGLEHQGEIVLGVAVAPAMGDRVWAIKGGGAFVNGEPVRTSPTSRLEDACLIHGSAGHFSRYGVDGSWRELVRSTRRQRGFGDYWGHLLVAAGHAEIMLDPVVAPYDLAALKIIVEEAGGQLTDYTGKATIYGGSAVTSNGPLHDRVVQILRRDPLPSRRG